MSGALAGLRVLVTGGSSGIGAATIAWLTDSGATVANLDRQRPASPSPAAADVVADITVGAAVDVAVCQAAEALGGLDAVVCNAGIGATGSVLDNDDQEWRHVFDVNLIGHVRVLRAAMPLLRESPSAAIVTVCSVVAESGFPQRALYSSSKGALLALSMSMAVDFLPWGIRVNAVCPGTTETPWVDRLLSDTPDPQASRLALQARQPTGRLVAADEVARAVGYLLDPVGRSTTGTVVYVDGGLSRLKPPAPVNAS